MEQSPSEHDGAPQAGDDIGLQRGEAEFIEMLVMSSCRALWLLERGGALRPGRASGSSCPARRGAPRLAGESLRAGDSFVRDLVLSSSSHSALLAGGFLAVEDDMEEEDEEEGRGGGGGALLAAVQVKHCLWWRMGLLESLGTALLLASPGLGLVNFMYQDTQTKKILCNFLVTCSTAGSCDLLQRHDSETRWEWSAFDDIVGAFFTSVINLASLRLACPSSSRKCLMMRRCATGVL